MCACKVVSPWRFLPTIRPENLSGGGGGLPAGTEPTNWRGTHEGVSDPHIITFAITDLCAGLRILLHAPGQGFYLLICEFCSDSL